MKNIIGEKDKCPKCNNKYLDYDDSEMGETKLSYPYACNECGFKGIEQYDVKFITHLTAEGEDIQVETDSNVTQNEDKNLKTNEDNNGTKVDLLVSYFERYKRAIKYYPKISWSTVEFDTYHKDHNFLVKIYNLNKNKMSFSEAEEKSHLELFKKIIE